MLRINKIKLGSAFRVSALLLTLFWLLLLILTLLFGGMFESATSDYYYDGYQQTELDAAGMITMVICLPFFAIVAGLMGAFYAFCYNLVANWVGGIELEVETLYSGEEPMMNKPKREEWGP
jgi:hypothetical protein